MDFELVMQQFKNDKSIKSIKAFHQPDGLPEIHIERFDDCSPTAKIDTLAKALGSCDSMEHGSHENSIRIDIGDKIVELMNEL